jgi:N,N'-diacetyllegionaminate synthase
VAKINILKGEVFSEKNITTKRPGNGLSPMKWDNVIGKIANKNFNEDDLIDIN